MSNKLQQLNKFTTIVADTGEVEAIIKFQPQDATTNPSLILKASLLPEYKSLIEASLAYAKIQSKNKKQQTEDTCDMLAVNIGKEILKVVPGRISTEVDARLSYDTQASVNKARQLIKMYNDAGISNDRILIKLASTWEGIKAAEILEKEGISCNLTLLFSFAQARACAEADVTLISPFVGRIMDWYKARQGIDFKAEDDPGVISVKAIYDYYKQYGYDTIVMGASFRNTGEVLELAGCDRLTISPQLLQELSEMDGPLEQKLSADVTVLPRPEKISHAQFLWMHNQDAMAVDKLAEGIRNFAVDQGKLESRIEKML
ncbi:transaldolase [Psychromonas aquimarina]|uniref:transaldolase n=1 Tax=Psychromonas aquimarina TaxID=444919 RepID=UPI000427D606|nr:transaldolase [Psychromonas aquimarina]